MLYIDTIKPDLWHAMKDTCMKIHFVTALNTLVRMKENM